MRCLPPSAARLAIVLLAAALPACSDEGPVDPGSEDEAILVLTPTSLSFDAVAGDAEPASATVDVANAGDGALGGLAATVAYAEGGPDGWLSASLDGSSPPAVLTVSASAADLSAGTYTATATVESSDADNDSVAVDVELVVEAAPAIALSDDAVTFETTEGGADPVDVTVDVTNVGGGTLDGLGTTVAYGDGQPTGWLTASLDVAVAPATLTLSATTGALDAGTYDATVGVTSAVADNSPQAVNVTVAVQTAGDVATLRDVVISEVNWFGNGADATDEWIEIRNNSGGELNLSGWSIDAAAFAGDPVTLADGTVLAAGAYLVIGAQQGADVDGERTSLTGVTGVQLQPVSLSDTGEQLVLRDVEGTLIDSTPTGDWPAGDDTGLRSMERYDDITGGGYGAGDTAASWYTWVLGSTDTTNPATVDSGTPGAHNSDPF